MNLSRRAVLGGGVAMGMTLAVTGGVRAAADKPTITVFKEPT